MKIRKIFANILAVMMIVISAFCFTACEDIVTVEVKFQAYNYETAEMYEDGEITLSIDLYRHLAPATVNSIIKNVNEGFYNNALVYKTTSNNNQFMIGDLKYDEDGNIVQVLAPQIKGEFASNGVAGSDLKVEKGSVGIWRSYYACDNGVSISSSARDTGRATWFLPTEGNSMYNGYMCVFGKIDLNEDAEEVYGILDSYFDESERYVEYQVYYTGTYDQTRPEENYGLTFNIALADNFEEMKDDIVDLFETDEDEQQLKMYDAYRIQVPVVARNGMHSLKVASVTIK